MRSDAQLGTAVYQLGHYGVALLLYAPIARLLVEAGFPAGALAGGVLVAAAAILPDCDELLPLPHRGPTHTVWFAGLVGLVAAGAIAALEVAGVVPRGGPGVRWSLIAGLLAAGATASHVAADAVTPMGVRPFAPASGWHVTLDLVPSKHRTANAGLFLLGGTAVVAALVL